MAVGTDISWNAATDATAYLISISSTSGNNNITDFDNGNNLTYNPPIDFDNDDVVTVTITPLNGTVQPTSTCASESFTIEEKKEDPITKVDSQYGFSPDGDGVNDFWEINGIENYPDNVVTIFNRWGDVVFQIEGYNNYSKVFQGEANKSTKMGAGRLPSGTYFFDIKIIGEHNLNKTRGYLILKR